ncbi:MAG: tyrosinase family protein [Verrucomicrobiota bacterium]|nr:tyrosinase family protein [Verrucomicrobiota bacterium]
MFPPPSRRGFLKSVAALAGGTVFAGAGDTFFGGRVFAQNPPGGCPAPPTGGTHFAPGSDTRPIVLRKSISALTTAETSKLKSAYAALRALPASDKRTWVLQADMHALFCASCTGTATDIHGTWNFFPWHRAYLYYYERILGSLVGDIDHFRLPNWDWENGRTLPSIYRSPNSAANSLWDGTRNSAMAGGGNLPVNDGSTARVHTLLAITDFVTFGGTASAAGTMEGNPHGHIHTDVGLPSPPYHDMGNLGYAARDPLFFAHHCNIDKIWSNWNARAGGSGLPPNAYKNPTNAAFLNARWSFYDEQQHVVSMSAADVLDHGANLRYTYDIARFNIPALQLVYVCKLTCCLPGPEAGSFLEAPEEAREGIVQSSRGQSPLLLVLQGVSVPANATGIFEVLSVRNERRLHLGSFSIVPHSGGGTHQSLQTVVLDIGEAAGDLLARENPAALRVVRRSPEREGYKDEAEMLRSERKLTYAFDLKAEHAEIRAEQPATR